jgi:hypothetical protein
LRAPAALVFPNLPPSNSRSQAKKISPAEKPGFAGGLRQNPAIFQGPVEKKRKFF